ncbi:MAG: DUF1924 domain-containing protein [Pseudomonadota bacterium]
MRHLLLALALLGPAATLAAPADLQAGYAAAARQAGAFQPFDAARGQRFFQSPHGGEWSCASCHTRDPRQAGRHDVTGKAIKPLAPAANPERFTQAAKVEKWFRRNCRDVLERECTAQEKGDVLAYLMSLK